MLKVDLNGWNTTHAKLETTRSPDDRPEHQFTRSIVKGMHPGNHNVVMRMDDISPQARADFLLEGRRDELSMCIKIIDIGSQTVGEVESPRPAGFMIRLPRNRYTPDHLFSDMLRKWFDLIPDLVDYTDDETINKGAPILMPPRAVDIVRPARVELVLCLWQASDWDYWSSPVRLKTFGHHITRAVNQFDDEFNKLEGWELPVKSTMELLAESTEKPKATRVKKTQAQ